MHWTPQRVGATIDSSRPRFNRREGIALLGSAAIQAQFIQRLDELLRALEGHTQLRIATSKAPALKRVRLSERGACS